MADGGSEAGMATPFECDVDEFLRHLTVVRNLSENTVRAYGVDLHSFGEWVSRRGVDPYAVSHRQLRGYLAEQTRAGYSAKTINRRLSAIRALYRWLVHEGRTTQDAVAAIASPKLARSLPHSMTDEEARAYKWAAVRAGLLIIAVFGLAFFLFIAFCDFIWFK